MIMRIKPGNKDNGSTLLMLKHTYLEKKTQRNLNAVLRCLAASEVYLGERSGEGKIKTDDGRLFEPVLITDEEGKRHLPVFSNLQVLPQEFIEDGISTKISAEICVEISKKINDLEGVVLDPFVEPVYLNFEKIDFLTHLLTSSK